MRWRVAAFSAALALAPGAAAYSGPKHAEPIPAATLALMAGKDTGPAAPILMRSFKKEGEIEVWKLARNGRYVLLKTFPVCRWSGQLGPKRRQGDRQTPEGFYAVSARQLNPNSSYYLSFNLGYPNAYDRAHGGSGSHLMVHGTCSSAGCFAMTDRGVAELYALAREAFAGGQGAFQFQSFPFRMSAGNLARHRSDPNIAFWRQLKEGSDRFEATGQEPSADGGSGRYVFGPFRDPAREALAKARITDEEAKFAALIADGAASIRTTYADGGQHPSFRLLAMAGRSLGEVSRPEALAVAGREIVITPARAKRPILLADARSAVGEVVRAAQAAMGVPSRVAAAEPSVFAPALIGYGAASSAFATLPIAGSPRMVPATLGAGRFEIASR